MEKQQPPTEVLRINKSGIENSPEDRLLDFSVNKCYYCLSKKLYTSMEKTMDRRWKRAY